MPQTSRSVWHEGEREIQRQAGVEEEAKRLALGIAGSLPPPVRMFLAEQRFAVISSLDGQGRVWASLRTGLPGFLSTPDAQTVQVKAGSRPGDPLEENVRQNPVVGMIVIDLAKRRRIRVNGEAEVSADGAILIHTRQVYGNCPRYIQLRVPVAEIRAETATAEPTQSSSLTQPQRAWIESADTFFIGTAHPTAGADASHRGGLPGFVRVEGDRQLLFPDYNGNSMFNTLGNLAVNPRAGLLFVDFETGRTLQLTGQTTIDWTPARLERFAGAERVVEFAIEEVRETMAEEGIRYRFVSYSPYDPRPEG